MPPFYHAEVPLSMQETGVFLSDCELVFFRRVCYTEGKGGDFLLFDLRAPVVLHRLLRVDRHYEKPWNNGYTPTDSLFIYLYSGEMEMAVGEEVVFAKAGELLTVPEGVFFRPLRVRDVCYYVLHFSARLATRLPPGAGVHVLPVTGAERLADAHELFLRAMTFAPQSTGVEKLMLDALTREILIAVSEEYATACAPGAGGLRRELLAYVGTHSSAPLSLSRLAAQFGYSPSYIARVFRREAGTSLSAYLARLRLERAAVLLASTDLGVGEIAAQVGIPNPYYFARRFAAAYGKSATAYRAAAREKRGK